MRTNFDMNFREKGLTVGELTMAVGAIILIALAWTAFIPKEAENTNSLNVPIPMRNTPFT